MTFDEDSAQQTFKVKPRISLRTSHVYYMPRFQSHHSRSATSTAVSVTGCVLFDVRDLKRRPGSEYDADRASLAVRRASRNLQRLVTVGLGGLVQPGTVPAYHLEEWSSRPLSRKGRL